MRRGLRIAGIICAVVCVVGWFALGANRGWTKTTRTRMQKDPVTEIEYPGPPEKYFSPGVEMLGAGLALSIALVGVSFFIKPKTN